MSATNLATLGRTEAIAANADWDKLQFGLGDLFVESGFATAGLTGAARAAALAGFQSSNSLAPVGGGYVAIDAVATAGDGAALLAELTTLGLRGGVSSGGLVGGYIPLDRIDDLAALGDLAFARPAYSQTNADHATNSVGAGSVVSQDTYSVNADVLQSSYGLTGAGQKIGILSDSFNTATQTTGNTTLTIHYADDVASGDLPGGVQILLDDSSSFVRDEGRAMAQLIYDVAPGADLAFHTAEGGQAVFAAGIQALANAGADIIVDDVFYYAEPFFQDGVIAQAVDTVTAGGAQYFSSAGNQAQQSYASAFTDSGQTYTNNGVTYRLHDFDPGGGVDTTQTVTQSGAAFYDFQWDDVYHSVTASGGAASDLALIFRQTDGTLIYIQDAVNIGGDPIELAGLSGSGTYTVSIGVRSTTPNPTYIKYLEFDGVTQNEWATNSSASFGHNNAAGAISVAAADWYNTPAYGQTPPLGESFTSRGGTPILFDTAGNRYATPVFRSSPDFTSADGGNNTFFGGDISSDADTLPNFYGTSAAAPVAAAVAALLHQGVPGATNAQIEAALKSTALDIQGLATGRPSHTVGVVTGVGYDLDTGFGLIQADAAYTALLSAASAEARDDAFSTAETTAIGAGLSLFADNGSGADSDPDGTLTVAAVNGAAGAVGVQIALASGALLTVNANGTFAYNPNHAFDTLTGTTGATNSRGTDSFTYALAGGNTATATITIAGRGTDVAYGTAGNDVLTGTIGDDYILGNGGADRISGGNGNDKLFIGATPVKIDGGTGSDILYIQSGTATIGNAKITGIENIQVYAGATVDLTGVVSGIASIRSRSGAGGTATIHGTDAGDAIYGGTGNDTLDGGAGSDTLTIYAQPTLVAGGADVDTLYVRNGISVAFTNTTLTGVERVFVYDGGTLDASAVTAGFGLLQSYSVTNGGVTIIGGGAADVLVGGRGHDTLSGGGGDDRINVSAQPVDVDGGAGTGDILQLNGIVPYVFNDTNLSGIERVILGGGVTANLAAVHGVIAISTAGVAGQRISVIGTADANRIAGGASIDTINGGGGADVLSGGTAADRFVFTSLADTAGTGGATDRILDFSHAERDKIYLNTIDADPALTGQQKFTFIGSAAFSGGSGYEARIQAGANGNSYIQFDTTHDGHADYSILVHSDVALTASDIIF